MSAQTQTTSAPTSSSVPTGGMLQRVCACGNHAGGGECAACRATRERSLQRAAVNSGPAAAPPIVHDVLRGSGQPLDPATRAWIEPRFGHDFSQVRVHTDARAADSAQAVSAHAYTVGRDIVFGAGRYAPGTAAGRRLLAHELTHVVQQANTAPPSVARIQIDEPDGATEREAHTLAAALTAGGPAPSMRRVAGPVLLRSPLDDDPIHRPLIEQYRREHGLPPGGVDEFGHRVGPSDAEIKYGQRPANAATAQVDPDEQRFREAQAEFFRAIGDSIRENVLKLAGFGPGANPTNATEALAVINLWGLTIADLVTRLPQIGQSTATNLRGSHEADTLDAQQTALIAALTPTGQQAYQQMLAQVRQEPFWRTYLDTHIVYIFPDLGGANRYSGYTQYATAHRADGSAARAFVIHISKDRLEANQVAASAATLVHELSHGLYDPPTISTAMQPFLRSLADLLADHPDIVALRQGASDPAQARRTHAAQIYQILFERTGYGEEEIFVHLQQLTHQPSEMIGTDRVRGSRIILDIVETYLENLKRIGLPQNLLLGILDSLGRRVAILYDRRIAAAPAGSAQRQSLQRDKELALLTLQVARNSTGASR